MLNVFFCLTNTTPSSSGKIEAGFLCDGACLLLCGIEHYLPPIIYLWQKFLQVVLVLVAETPQLVTIVSSALEHHLSACPQPPCAWLLSPNNDNSLLVTVAYGSILMNMTTYLFLLFILCFVSVILPFSLIHLSFLFRQSTNKCVLH